jgi:hypothetical protein
MHVFDARVNGMQNFQPLTIETTLSAIRRCEREAFFIPVGISGDNKIHNPDKRRATWRGIGAGIGVLPAHISNVKVGIPIKASPLIERLKQLNPDIKLRQALDEFMGRQVASLLPPERQGVFREE